MDAKIIAGILAAGGAALAAGGVYRMNKKTGYFKKGNSVRYDVSRIPFKKTSPLKGKTVVFLGSSVTKGFAAHNNAFAEYNFVIPVFLQNDNIFCLISDNHTIFLTLPDPFDSFQNLMIRRKFSSWNSIKHLSPVYK